MQEFYKKIKKYFILLLIFIPLSRILVALILNFGPQIITSLNLSPEIMNSENIGQFAMIVELIAYYLCSLIITINILMDLKENRKLIGISLLTFLFPVFGVTLFLIQQYYWISKNNMI
jgi:hypothetical protein